MGAEPLGRGGSPGDSRAAVHAISEHIADRRALTTIWFIPRICLYSIKSHEGNVTDSIITGISLSEVRKLIEGKSTGESIFDAVDKLLTAVIVLSPLAAGPAALPLLALIGPKSQLIELSKAAIKKITKSKAIDYLDRAADMSAANCLLTFTAYFEALAQRLPTVLKHLKLTEEEKEIILKRAVNHAAGTSASGEETDLLNIKISIPHPAVSDDFSIELRLGLYRVMSGQLLKILSTFTSWDRMSDSDRQQLSAVAEQKIPQLATSIYQAEYLGMAIEFPQFFIWNVLQDQDAKKALITRVGADVRAQFELVGLALNSVDLGLQRLANAINHIPRQEIIQPRYPELSAVAESLHRHYADQIEYRIIEDHYALDEGRPQLTYPKKVDAFVPQAYRLVRYDDAKLHLEREDQWTACEVRDDLGPFFMRHLESPYSVETPLLVLGHPGSGKSLLSEVIAARLAYPSYTTVRVELRDVNPDADIQAQIEGQIRKDTGRDINWADFADNLALNPPIVILDGYDELLQATGKLFADYLDQVRRFQHREAVQRRPVRVIVTSRITLIDKALVPLGTTIARLEEFNAGQRTAWTGVWNEHNDGYFRLTGTEPFELPTNDNILQLAKQPLLLLMLAIYDSVHNKLSSQPNIDQTLLYDALLTRFIERERSKGNAGISFMSLHEAERKEEINREMERLGVAAIGMFNRQAVHIHRDELNADLKYFDAEQSVASDGTRRLSQADLLLGSFFFIHESKSKVIGDSIDPDMGPAAFEFLHNTFGEFLAADFILRRTVEETKTICALSGNSALEDALKQRLAIMRGSWFACLIYTPLHTRPNILSMLREWSKHRLCDSQWPQTDLLKSLNTIVSAQLRSILTEVSLPDFTPRGRDLPYTPLPKLGHLAIYSLNLILLGSFTGEGMYTLKEEDLGAQPGGIRAWDRLINVWRSWFPLESLGALASLVTATREGAQVVVDPVQSSLTVPNSSNLYTAYNVGVALADDITAASAGIHVASLTRMAEEKFTQLRNRVQPEVPTLMPVIDSILPRFYDGHLSSALHAVSSHPAGWAGYEMMQEQLMMPGYLLNITEAVDRVLITPNQRVPVRVEPSGLRGFRNLSRYEAELTVHMRIQNEPRWLPHLLNSAAKEIGLSQKAVWLEFILSPAAAPVLRAALRHLDERQCVLVSSSFAKFTSAEPFAVFDIDTASALAVLYWHGGHAELCVQMLDVVMDSCEHHSWDALDIPIDTWYSLAELFTSHHSDVESRRIRFARIIDETLSARKDGSSPGFDTSLNNGLAEFWINALRIGISKHQKTALKQIFDTVKKANEFHLQSTVSWRCYFLLIRWMRENDDVTLLRKMFTSTSSRPSNRSVNMAPKEIDISNIKDTATYQEVMDLRWAVDVLRKRGDKRRDAAAD